MIYLIIDGKSFNLSVFILLCLHLLNQALFHKAEK